MKVSIVIENDEEGYYAYVPELSGRRLRPSAKQGEPSHL